MLFGLDNNTTLALGTAAFVYFYGMQYQATRGLVGGLGGAGIAAAVAGGAVYYLKLGDKLFGMLGM
jgi:hypothetical protein